MSVDFLRLYLDEVILTCIFHLIRNNKLANVIMLPCSDTYAANCKNDELELFLDGVREQLSGCWT